MSQEEYFLLLHALGTRLRDQRLLICLKQKFFYMTQYADMCSLIDVSYNYCFDFRANLSELLLLDHQNI